MNFKTIHNQKEMVVRGNVVTTQKEVRPNCCFKPVSVSQWVHFSLQALWSFSFLRTNEKGRWAKQWTQRWSVYKLKAKDIFCTLERSGLPRQLDLNLSLLLYMSCFWEPCPRVQSASFELLSSTAESRERGCMASCCIILVVAWLPLSFWNRWLFTSDQTFG